MPFRVTDLGLLFRVANGNNYLLLVTIQIHVTLNYLPPGLTNEIQQKNTSNNMSCSMVVVLSLKG